MTLTIESNVVNKLAKLGKGFADSFEAAVPEIKKITFDGNPLQGRIEQTTKNGAVLYLTSFDNFASKKISINKKITIDSFMKMIKDGVKSMEENPRYMLYKSLAKLEKD